MQAVQHSKGKPCTTGFHVLEAGSLMVHLSIKGGSQLKPQLYLAFTLCRMKEKSQSTFQLNLCDIFDNRHSASLNSKGSPDILTSDMWTWLPCWGQVK